MKRRDFFKKGTAGAVAASIIPITSTSIVAPDLGDRDVDQWYHLGKGKKDIPNRKETLDYDVVVFGRRFSRNMCCSIGSTKRFKNGVGSGQTGSWRE